MITAVAPLSQYLSDVEKPSALILADKGAPLALRHPDAVPVKDLAKLERFSHEHKRSDARGVCGRVISQPVGKFVQISLGVEGVAALVRQAAYNAELNNLKNVRFFPHNQEEDVAHQPWAAQGFNKVLLDPARWSRGCDVAYR